MCQLIKESMIDIEVEVGGLYLNVDFGFDNECNKRKCEVINIFLI